MPHYEKYNDSEDRFPIRNKEDLERVETVGNLELWGYMK